MCTRVPNLDSRPYFGHSNADLEDVVRHCWDDIVVLGEVRDELHQRRSRLAKEVAERIEQRVADLHNDRIEKVIEALQTFATNGLAEKLVKERERLVKELDEERRARQTLCEGDFAELRDDDGRTLIVTTNPMPGPYLEYLKRNSAKFKAFEPGHVNTHIFKELYRVGEYVTLGDTGKEWQITAIVKQDVLVAASAEAEVIHGKRMG